MRLPKAAFTLLRIARELRYRTFDEVVGRSLTIRSASTVIEDVTAALGEVLRDTTAPSPSLGAVAKYGLLDLEFPSQRAWSLPRMTIRDLAALDLLTSQENPDVGIEALMLDAQDDTRDVTTKLKQMRGLPSDYFPRQFRVRDACVTNGPTIWLGKHFYL